MSQMDINQLGQGNLWTTTGTQSQLANNIGSGGIPVTSVQRHFCSMNMGTGYDDVVDFLGGIIEEVCYEICSAEFIIQFHYNHNGTALDHTLVRDERDCKNKYRVSTKNLQHMDIERYKEILRISDEELVVLSIKFSDALERHRQDAVKAKEKAVTEMNQLMGKNSILASVCDTQSKLMRSRVDGVSDAMRLGLDTSTLSKMIKEIEPATKPSFWEGLFSGNTKS